MSSLLLKSTARAARRINSRCLHVTGSLGTVHTTLQPLDEKKRDEIYPYLGNRDIVGYGHYGEPVYMDRFDVPCPAIRWKANTEDVLSLREKEKGDWRNLTIEEKKALYRASFAQTFAEIGAPTSEWRFHVGATIWSMVLTALVAIFMDRFVYEPLPESVTNEEVKLKLAERMIKQGTNPITGMASEYDYENRKWK